MKQFETQREESRQTRYKRWLFNYWPCIWCSGGTLEFIASDWMELHVSLKLNLRTRNRVNTVFGGSIYSSIDPYFMLMFMEVLGKEYVVWDKEASVKFVRPILEKVKCRFLIDAAMLDNIKNQVDAGGEYTFTIPLQYEDDGGKVYALFSKTIYVASKSFYKKKLERRKK